MFDGLALNFWQGRLKGLVRDLELYRTELRALKDYTTSDKLRDILRKHGVAELDWETSVPIFTKAIKENDKIVYQYRIPKTKKFKPFSESELIEIRKEDERREIELVKIIEEENKTGKVGKRRRKRDVA